MRPTVVHKSLNVMTPQSQFAKPCSSGIRVALILGWEASKAIFRFILLCKGLR